MLPNWRKVTAKTNFDSRFLTTFTHFSSSSFTFSSHCLLLLKSTCCVMSLSLGPTKLWLWFYGSFPDNPKVGRPSILLTSVPSKLGRRQRNAHRQIRYRQTIKMYVIKKGAIRLIKMLSHEEWECMCDRKLYKTFCA